MIRWFNEYYGIDHQLVQKLVCTNHQSLAKFQIAELDRVGSFDRVFLSSSNPNETDSSIGRVGAVSQVRGPPPPHFGSVDFSQPPPGFLRVNPHAATSLAPPNAAAAALTGHPVAFPVGGPPPPPQVLIASVSIFKSFSSWVGFCPSRFVELVPFQYFFKSIFAVWLHSSEVSQ